MRKRLWLALLPLAIMALLSPGWLGNGSDAAPAVRRPKLVLILIIDQFRFDYLVRFRPQFVERGLNLLLGGANFVDCRYNYTSTATGPGHASLSTGAYPSLHGIVGNEWYDRALQHTVNCVGDPDEKAVGATGPGASPRNLIGSTVSDELRIATGFESKVVSISLKDRGAILPGGHTANAAYWFDSRSGRFITSTYYMQSLPVWAATFDDALPAKTYCGKSWQALPETPGAQGRVLKEFRPTANEPCPDEKFLSWLDGTPYMTEIQLNFARQAIEHEHLGQGSGTDLLSLSISENDHVGHTYGPYSEQVADVTLRTDRYLSDFFKDLDHAVGLDNVWIMLSADHGVSPNYPFIQEHRLGTSLVGQQDVANAVEKALSQAFQPGHWVTYVGDHYDVYLDSATLQKHHVEEARAEAVAAEGVARLPGVVAVFTRSQLLSGQLLESPLARKVANSFNGQRSGDVHVVPAPYVIGIPGKVNTEHGTPWNYDAQVPLIFWGSAFKPGVYSTPCQPIDLAATLAVALGLTQPSDTQGRPLTEAIR